MSNYKEETKKAYNSSPNYFNNKFSHHFELYVKDKANSFLKLIKGENILDMGAGPGTHALYFKNKGFNVLCIDNSEEMIKLCKEKGLNAQLIDIENINFEDCTFDGIWAYASLLHLHKDKINNVLHEIKKMLVPSGIFGLSMKEGKKDGFEEKGEYAEGKRWFSYYEEKELKEILEKDFKIIKISRTIGNNSVFMHFLLEKINS